MKQQKSLATNSKTKKRLIIMGCCLGGVGLIGGGIGIGYAIWYSTHKDSEQDTIKFGNYNASMSSGTQTISASSSAGKTVTLTASGDEKGTAWSFHDNILTYRTVDTKVTVTITAKDSNTENSIKIDLVQQSFNIHCIDPSLVVGEAGTLDLTWDSANFTPVKVELSTDNNSDTDWSLSQNNPIQPIVKLDRADVNLAANVYNVYFTATDAGGDTKEAFIAVTISNPVQKDLFFVTGDTSIYAGSDVKLYGTLAASNFDLDPGNLQVLLNGGAATEWTVQTFPGQKMIKITHPAITAGSTYKISFRDDTNNVTSNQITFKGISHNASPAETGKYIKVDEAGTKTTVTYPNISLILNDQSPKLVGLYLGTYPDLIALSCTKNHLSTLDVSSGTNLTNLNCSENYLSTLDVSSNPALGRLDCYSNYLSTLDVSNNHDLTILYCSGNSLTTLDVSSNPDLTNLECYNNSLSTLDVSSNPDLTNLNCSNNSLSTLDVSSNHDLTALFCYNNSLSTLYLPAFTNTCALRMYGNPSLTNIYSESMSGNQAIFSTQSSSTGSNPGVITYHTQEESTATISGNIYSGGAAIDPTYQRDWVPPA